MNQYDRIKTHCIVAVVAMLGAVPACAQVTLAPPDSLARVTVTAAHDPSYPFVSSESNAAAIVEGNVVDEAGKPFYYAFVVVAGTTWGVWTDRAGHYRLPVPAKFISRRGRVKVVVGIIGYLRQILRLNIHLPTQPTIQLRPDTRPLS